MKRVLNITNGDSAVNIMREAGIEGDFLPWRDVLHVGPVPANLSFANLSEIRAEYIANQGWGEVEMIDQSFQERLVLMSNIEKYEKIVLWFEHDLYDQLQLLEILNYLSEVSYDLSKISIVCTENYLGRLTISEMASMQKYEEPVSTAQRQLAVRAWDAFRSPIPDVWSELLREDISVLPFLEGTVLRMLEEYPSTLNGLSRIQQDILEIVSQGEEMLGKIFVAQQEREERVFLGDTVFMDTVNEMLDPNSALLTSEYGEKLTLPFSPEKKVKITAYGLEILYGKQHWLEKHTIGKWLGGVHLNPQNIWLWNSNTKELERG
jgi:hypothetical protein